MRTIVDLPEPQLEGLDDWCRRERISRAEGVRRAVEAYIGARRAAGPDPAFGVWAGRAVDGLTYQRRIRREWDQPATPVRASRRSPARGAR